MNASVIQRTRQCAVDQLVLIDEALPAESRPNNDRFKMVPRSGHVLDRHLGPVKAGLKHLLYFLGFYHKMNSFIQSGCAFGLIERL